jgi:hypothetical protein
LYPFRFIFIPYIAEGFLPKLSFSPLLPFQPKLQLKIMMITNDGKEEEVNEEFPVSNSAHPIIVSGQQVEPTAQICISGRSALNEERILGRGQSGRDSSSSSDEVLLIDESENSTLAKGLWCGVCGYWNV